MLKLCAFLIFICITEVYTCNCTANTDLVMVFLVNQHGDRTPLKSELFFSKSRYQLEDKCKKYGYGELTDVGKARCFALGKLYRSLYNDMLSPSYDPKKVYVHASEFTRTVMTAKIALTAAYSPATEWCENMQLLPIECNVVPQDQDINIAFKNCPKYLNYFYDTFKTCPKEMDPYKQLLQEVSQSTCVNLVKYPISLYSLYDLCVSQLSLGIPLCEIQQKWWDKMGEAATIVLDKLEGNEDYLSLQAGGLLKEFHDIADLIKAGVDTPKFRMYSTHKFNVYSFLAAIHAKPKQSVPKYCSVAGIELRKSRIDGRYLVTPIYIGSPDEMPQYLEIDGCGVLCDLEQFKALTSKYILDKDDYKTKCKSDDSCYIGYTYDNYPQKMYTKWHRFFNFYS